MRTEVAPAAWEDGDGLSLKAPQEANRTQRLRGGAPLSLGTLGHDARTARTGKTRESSGCVAWRTGILSKEDALAWLVWEITGPRVGGRVL